MAKLSKDDWKTIFHIVITILTAIGTALGITACVNPTIFLS